ncbi:uncharacterized protein MELLADRAFT_111250 [Melampsora larici-populina 98AG31]|uniref:Uncharacterized protein n=1 Tax=Melampsora larici-populina (strain 98AG31 / pathotype 3-4-7) TaxID=747676 RepID=F4S2J9_MELLP|nr:uncharacterized protein MELLADRAFT_111250 [Melampsora larici-populina 98AG31]EGG01197.1 hypothetical protein MELLADRAFT_111250 [Melampsora larici-populina 98AG31]
MLTRQELFAKLTSNRNTKVNIVPPAQSSSLGRRSLQTISKPKPRRFEVVTMNNANSNTALGNHPTNAPMNIDLSEGAPPAQSSSLGRRPLQTIPKPRPRRLKVDTMNIDNLNDASNNQSNNTPMDIDPKESSPTPSSYAEVFCKATLR